MIHPEIAMFKELHKVDLTLGLEVTISPECEYYEPQYDAGMKYKVTALHVDAGGINIGLSDSTHVSEPPHERWLIETDGFRWGDVTPVLSALTAHPQQVKSEDARLLSFAQDIMRCWPEGDVDGGHLQDTAEKHGLIVPETRYESCADEFGAGCNCSGCYSQKEWDAGVTCYRRTPLLNGDAAISAQEPNGDS